MAIIINVGGKLMKTYISTLKQLPYFQSYIERWSNNEELFIDYDPKLFLHLLNKLRDKNYEMPNNNNINNMCQYFGYDQNITKINIVEDKIPSGILTKSIYGRDKTEILKNEKIISINLNLQTKNNLCIQNSKNIILDVKINLGLYFKYDKYNKTCCMRKKYVKIINNIKADKYIYTKENSYGEKLGFVILLT